MISKLQIYGKFGNLFCGVEHTYCNGQEKINSLQLKKKKDEFVIENSLECETIAELKNHLPAKQHLFLIVNNEKVLFKVLKGVFDTTQKAMASAFPNLLLEDFYYEILQTDTHTFMAICRKEIIDELLNVYRKSQLHVVGFSLGNLIVSQLSNFIEGDLTLQTSNGSIFFASQKIRSIDSLGTVKEDLYTINGLQINRNSVVSLAGIISYYTNQRATISNFWDTTDWLQRNFTQQRIFDSGLKIGLGTVFVLLLVSFLFFSHYTTVAEKLSASLELNKTHKNSLLKLSDVVSKKEQLVTRFSLASSKTSWYLDQIGGSVPRSVLLSEILYQPLIKRVIEEKEILLHQKVIIIKGRSDNGTDFSSWIQALELNNWIEKVIIKEYGFGKKKLRDFELSIKIKS